MNTDTRPPRARFLHALAALITLAGLVLSACQPASTPPPTATVTPPPSATPIPPTATPVPVTLADIAEKVAKDVGQATTVVEGKPDQVIFLFEERHDSRLGQVEIAIMLDRLYEDYNLRHIGLEGQPASEGPLDLAWAHEEPYFGAGDAITGREDVIVQTLEDGEISSAETMGLTYNDAVIDGIDDAKLYGFEPPAAAWDAPKLYLYNIALAGMSNTERTAWRALYDQEQYDDAFAFAASTDEQVNETWTRLSDTVNVVSAEGWIEVLGQLREQAAAAGATMTAEEQANLEAMNDYFDHVSKRSDAMAANMLALAAANPGAPVAMTVGALHTARLVELFTQAGVSFAVLRPQSLAEGSEAGLLSSEAFLRKANGLSVDPAGWLGSFLDGRKKPPPVSEGKPYKAEEAARKLAQELAEFASLAAKDGTRSAAQIRDGLQALVDQNSESYSLQGIDKVTIDKVNIYTTTGTVSVEFNILIGDTFIMGVAKLVENVPKAEVNIVERLELSRDALEQAPPPAPGEQSETKPQKVCSNTEVSWSKAGG